MTATFAYVIGLLLFVLGVLVGSLRQATVTLQRDRRRRHEQTRAQRADVESWLPSTDWIVKRPTGEVSRSSSE